MLSQKSLPDVLLLLVIVGWVAGVKQIKSVPSDISIRIFYFGVAHYVKSFLIKCLTALICFVKS